MLPLELCGPAAASHREVENQVALERFARFLVVKGYAAATQRLYMGTVERWFAAGGSPGHVDLELLQGWLRRRRLQASVATVNLEIKGVRAFYRYAQVFHDVPATELHKIPRMKKLPPRLPRWLSDEEIGMVLGRLPLDTFVGLRDYAMILTLYVTGLRAGELIRMRTDHLLAGNQLYVEGKARRDRYVPIGRQLAGVLEGYLHARAALKPGKTHAFWLSRHGLPLRNGRSAWEITSRRIWQALGVEGGIGKLSRGGRPWQGHFPHELRASFATVLMKNGCPITAIAEMMGHARLETTARYLGVDLEHLRGAARLHPRARRQNGISSSAGQSEEGAAPSPDEASAGGEAGALP